MRKMFLFLTLAVCFSVLLFVGHRSFAQSAVSVTVSSPAANATVTSPVEIKATGSSSYGMDGWYIYVDNNAAWHTAGPTSSIDAKVSMSVGKHYVVVRGWDKVGHSGSSSFYVNVVQAQSTTTTVTLKTPVSGTNVTSPVAFQATATSPNGIDGWVIYCDLQNVYQVNNGSNSLSASVSLGVGSHSCFVRAWDKVSGSGSSATALINVQDATAPAPTPAPVTATTVTVSSPSNGSTLPSSSPVTFKASATSPNGIDGWVIYANDQNVYQVNNQSNSLSASVSLAAGTYKVYIRAWDKVSGYGTSATFSITLTDTTSSSGGTTSGSPVVTPPADAITFTQEQNNPSVYWNQTSAEAGGSNVTTDFWQAPFQTSPSMSGSSREFHVGGPVWTAALFYHKLQLSSPATMTHMLIDYDFYVDPASQKNVWDLEYDTYQAINGYEYMMGTHCIYGSGYWETYNQSAGHWVKTTIPCSTSLTPPGKWNHIEWYVGTDPSTKTYIYYALSVNGTVYWLNQTQPAGPISWSDVLGVQWQIDTNSNGGSANEWIDNVKVTVWGNSTTTATAAPAPSPTPTPTTTASLRYYSDTSFLNTLIASSPVIDANSAGMVSTALLPYATNSHVSNTDTWGPSVAYATSTSTSYTVKCTTYCTGDTVTFRIPAGAQPSTGSDHHLMVVDGTSELDMWEASYDSATDSWSAGSRVVNDLYGWGACGLPGQHCNGAYAAGFAGLAGLIRPEEIQAGHIDHALQLVTPYTRSGYIACPATHTDGKFADANALPEGARVQLDPTFDVGAQSWPLWEKIVAKALQQYGAYVSDTGGSLTVRGVGDLNLSTTWASVGMPKGGSLSNLPWGRMQVMQLQSCN